MLFHVQMTHSVDECPAYNREKVPDLVAGAEQLGELANQFNVKVLFWVNGLPDHVEFALLDAENTGAVAMFLSNYPLKVQFKTTSVMHQSDVMEMAKGMMAQGG